MKLQSRKLILLISLILLLSLFLIACEDKEVSSINDYDWEHNSKVPKDKKKLLSQVIKNGEVIEDYKYDKEGKLINSLKKVSVMLDEHRYHYYLNPLTDYFFDVKYIYDKDNRLIKSEAIIRDEDKKELTRNKTTYEYDERGREIKKEIHNEKYGGLYLFETKYDQKDRVVYKRELKTYIKLNKETFRKYNQYDKLICEEVLWNGEQGFLKKYTDEEEPKILRELNRLPYMHYKDKEYQHDKDGKLLLEINSNDPDNIEKTEYIYNKKGLLKSEVTRVEGEVKVKIDYYYNQKGELLKKEYWNGYCDTKSISEYQGNKMVYNQIKCTTIKKIALHSKIC